MRLLNKFPQIAAVHLPVFHHTKAFEYVTGMKMPFGKYLRCGERGYNLEREINRRFGVNAGKDALPKRLTDVRQDAADPTSKVPLDKLKKVYYNARGGDKNGLPTKRLLKKLEIEEKRHV